MKMRKFMLFLNLVFVIVSIIAFTIITNLTNAVSQDVYASGIYTFFIMVLIGGFVMLGLCDIMIYYVYRKAKNPGMIV